MDITHAIPELTEGELTIASALVDMAIARGGTFDDYQTPVYLRGLVDLDARLVARACEQIGLETRASYEQVVPAVGIIRARVVALSRDDAAKEAAAKLLPAPVAEPDEKPYFCLECRDEPHGWRTYWCRGKGPQAVIDQLERTGVLPCARRHSHDPHTYVDRCGCYEVNPVSAAHRRRMAEFQTRKSMR